MRPKRLVLVAVALVAAAPALHGRPEILARYAADSWSRPELRTCSTCHLNPAGGGPRNDFGRAVAAEGFQITPFLRRMFPDRFLPSRASEALESQGRSVKAAWSAAREEQAVVQLGEEYFLLDRAAGTLTKISAEQLKEFMALASVESPAETIRPSEKAAVKKDELELRTLPTFEYYLVNLPTNRPRPPRSLHLRFSHRFDKALTGERGLLRDLFGFDSVSVSSFGLELGLTKWLSFMTFRMPLLGRAAQTIEMGPTLRLLEQDPRVPLSLSFRATVEGERNFTERFTTNFQPVISRAFGTRAEIFVVPTFSIAVPRRTLTFDSPITPGEERDNLASIGLGASVRIRPRTALVAEWMPRVAGFRGFQTRNTYSFAVQRSTSRHVFGLVFSNNSLNTATRAVTDGHDDFRIGFNLYRRLF